VRENGEVVIGMYSRFGCSKAPQAINDDVIERLRSPAQSVVLTGRR
jgi:hypothetical protein